MKMSPGKQRLWVVAGLLVWSGTLILLRLHRGGDGLATGLLWNLFLAVVPLGWSAAFRRAMRANRPFLAGGAFGLWLLFFPNAPYLLTDLLHLAPCPGVPLWFVLAMLLSCAGTGTLLGYFSLGEVHAAIEEHLGPVVGWSVVSGSLLLCGFGIYVGRFLRWNSWDALTRPQILFRSLVVQVQETGQHPHPVPVTLIFSGGLLLGYLALRVTSITSPTRN